MRPSNYLIPTSTLIWFTIILMAFLVQGCTEPFVSVNVKTGAECVTDEDGVGGCRPPMPYVGSAAHFWDDEANQWIPAGTNKQCVGASQKCKSFPGFCSGQSCISRYDESGDPDPNEGLCWCGCVPTI